MSELISVVIPTYCRPEMLRVTLDSVLAQDYRPMQLIITDDSPDDASERMVQGFVVPDGIELVYRRNTPALRQAGNVNQGFGLAAGQWTVLIHDDDALLPGCIETLVAASREHPEAVLLYGRQRVWSHDGSDDGDGAAEWANRLVGRTSDRVGVQPDALSAALTRQVPNNGYLVRTESARAVGYRPESEVGHVCDFDFGVRLAQRHPGQTFVLVSAYTSAYRVSAESVSRSNAGGASFGYRICERVDAAETAEAARVEALRRFACGAVSELVAEGHRTEARAIYHGAYYTGRWTVRGVLHRGLVSVPMLDRVSEWPLGWYRWSRRRFRNWLRPRRTG
ncbi:MAG: glycosyltransferase family 2 protein [Planctomycetota bacterium]